MICAYSAQKWLHILRLEYKNMSKNVFMDAHEQTDNVEDWNHFLSSID